MARTEKKFGQALQVPAGTTVTDLTATSANRRNVLINATARGTDTLTVLTTTGTMAGASAGASTSATSTTDSALLSGSPAANTFFDGNTTAYHMMIPNKAFTKLAGTSARSQTEATYYTVNTQTGAITSSGVTSSNWNGSYANFWSQNYIANYQANMLSSPIIAYGNSGSERLLATFGSDRHSNITSNSNYYQWVTMNDFDSPSQRGSYGYVAGTSSYETPFALGDPGFAGNGYGLILASNFSNGGGQSYDIVIAEVDSSANANIYAGAYTYRAWGSGIDGEPAANTFWPFHYNSTHDIYAISTPTMTWGSMGQTTSGTFNIQIPTWTANAHPGFRVQNRFNSGNAIRAVYEGSYVFPALPTGVTVPQSNPRPVTALKFSPDGQRLAVFYRRSYTGSGNTNSVMVIYTRNSGTGVWEHTHSSGASLPVSTRHQDLVDWSPDSTLVGFLGTDNKFYVWSLGLNAPAANSSISYVGGAPSLNAGTISAPVVHAAGAFTNTPTVTNGSQTHMVRAIPTTSGPYRWALFHYGVNKYFNTADFIGKATAQTTGSVSVTNYVNTVAQSIPMVSGNVTQVTGVVLEAGEKLQVQAGTGGLVDVTAYGVEIS